MKQDMSMNITAVLLCSISLVAPEKSLPQQEAKLEINIPMKHEIRKDHLPYLYRP